MDILTYEVLDSVEGLASTSNYHVNPAPTHPAALAPPHPLTPRSQPIPV